jgi:hypothetical protein
MNSKNKSIESIAVRRKTYIMRKYIGIISRNIYFVVTVIIGILINGHSIVMAKKLSGDNNSEEAIGALIAIARHGDLTDIGFVGKLLSTKFDFRNENLATIDEGKTLNSEHIFEQVPEIFRRSKFFYKIFSLESNNTKFVNIKPRLARLAVTDADKSFCLTMSRVMIEFPGQTPTIYKGSPPPVPPRQWGVAGANTPVSETFEFSVFNAPNYYTTISFSANSPQSQCIKSVSIDQFYSK